VRVLITNKSLALRGGTQLYVRDLALGLLARGHTPIVYSLELGEAARDLHAATVPVVDDLSALGAPPDVVHGHGSLETMAALLRFPSVPGVFVCHGWWSWYAAPPVFPRLLRYVAVDETCRDRLLLRSGIPEARIRVLLNAVDLARFRPRPRLPERPRRALVFSNNASELTHLDVVRRACQQAGLTLDTVGFASGNPSGAPEAILGQYDIVFAKARSALESLAVGPAVILCDAMGMGGMVTAAELDRLRRLNFGARALGEPLTVSGLVREIQRYDARDAAEVSRRVRQLAGATLLIDDLIALYHEVLDEHAGSPLRDPEAEVQAASEYLQWLGRRMGEESDSVRLFPVVGLANRLLRLPLIGPLVGWLARTAAGRPRTTQR
jgi:hypothetical protein